MILGLWGTFSNIQVILKVMTVVMTVITPIIVFMLLPVIVLESVAVILVILGKTVEISLILLFDKYC